MKNERNSKEAIKIGPTKTEHGHKMNGTGSTRETRRRQPPAPLPRPGTGREKPTGLLFLVTIRKKVPALLCVKCNPQITEQQNPRLGRGPLRSNHPLSVGTTQMLQHVEI